MTGLVQVGEVTKLLTGRIDNRLRQTPNPSDHNHRFDADHDLTCRLRVKPWCLLVGFRKCPTILEACHPHSIIKMIRLEKRKKLVSLRSPWQLRISVSHWDYHSSYLYLGKLPPRRSMQVPNMFITIVNEKHCHKTPKWKKNAQGWFHFRWHYSQNSAIFTCRRRTCCTCAVSEFRLNQRFAQMKWSLLGKTKKWGIL